MSQRNARPGSDDSGTSAIELAILAPLLLLLIFGFIQIGLWAYGRNVAEQAAREGVARIRLIQPGDPQAQNKVDDAVTWTTTYAGNVGGQGLLGAKVDPAPVFVKAPDGLSEQVSVTVTGHVISLVPGWSFTVSRSATGELEDFRADS